MSNDPAKHHRRSLRLKEYDYSWPGAYFFTICVQNRECLFGEIQSGETCLSDAGRMVAKWWLELEHKFPNIKPGVFVVMPNHFHGIIYIIATDGVGADLRVGPDTRNGQNVQGNETDVADEGAHTGAPLPPISADGNVGAELCVGPDARGGEARENLSEGTHAGVPLPEVLQWFKTMTTNEYVRGVKNYGWPRFSGKLWQRNYFEHIIRNEAELERIYLYIHSNALNWEQDKLNPSVPSKW